MGWRNEAWGEIARRREALQPISPSAVHIAREKCALPAARGPPPIAAAAAAAASAAAASPPCLSPLRLRRPCALLAAAQCSSLPWRLVTRCAAQLLCFMAQTCWRWLEPHKPTQPDACYHPHHPCHLAPYRPQLPTDVKLNYFDAEGNMQEVTVGSLTKGKKVSARLDGQRSWAWSADGRSPATRLLLLVKQARLLQTASANSICTAASWCVPNSSLDDALTARQPPCYAAQVVLFAVPGAFTPTCSLKHLPGFIEKVRGAGRDAAAACCLCTAFRCMKGRKSPA